MYNDKFPFELITGGTEGNVQIFTKERQVQTYQITQQCLTPLGLVR